MRAVLTWPVGRAENANPRSRPAAAGPVVAYAIRATLGGGLVGELIAWEGDSLLGLGTAAELGVVLITVALVVTAAALEWNGRISPLPERRAQVPRHWLLWGSRTSTAGAFGLMIGAGVFTHLKHAVVYAVAALILLAPSVWLGVLLGAIYGFTRGGILVATWGADRFVGRRPPWWALAEPTAGRDRVLAVAALLSFSVTVLAVT
jgi:hypothetical protein